MKAQAIFVEAGHGKGTILPDLGASGRIGEGKVYERDFAVLIATEILRILKTKEEIKSLIIQGVGIETSANVRKKMQYVNTVMTENHLDPTNCFGVAIHMNSGAPTACGFETWYQKSSKSFAFANDIVQAWHEYALTPLRQKPLNNSANGRFGRFYIDDTQARYVIIETGFITNEAEAKTIKENIPRVAEAIAHGILQYIRTLNN